MSYNQINFQVLLKHMKVKIHTVLVFQPFEFSLYILNIYSHFSLGATSKVNFLIFHINIFSYFSVDNIFNSFIIFDFTSYCFTVLLILLFFPLTIYIYLCFIFFIFTY